jgi:hypothetical protein
VCDQSEQRRDDAARQKGTWFIPPSYIHQTETPGDAFIDVDMHSDYGKAISRCRSTRFRLWARSLREDMDSGSEHQTSIKKVKKYKKNQDYTDKHIEKILWKTFEVKTKWVIYTE